MSSFAPIARRLAFACVATPALLSAQAASSANPLGWFNLAAARETPSRIDANALVIATAESAGVVYASLGPFLPDSVRIEMTISQSGCSAGAAVTSGIAFANRGSDNPLVVELRGSGEMLITELGALGAGTQSWPAYAAGVKRRVRFDLLGSTVVVTAEGRELGRKTFDRPLAGAFGLLAGGEGCETRYEDMRVSFLRPAPARVTAPAAAREALSLLDSAAVRSQQGAYVGTTALTLPGNGGALLHSRADALLASPARLDATFTQEGCAIRPGNVVGLAFGYAQGRTWGLLEVTNGQWILRTLGGGGAAGDLPANLVSAGAPVTLSVELSETVVTATVNGTVVGTVNLTRPLTGRWGIIKQGCATRVEQLRVSASN